MNKKLFLFAMVLVAIGNAANPLKITCDSIVLRKDSVIGHGVRVEIILNQLPAAIERKLTESSGILKEYKASFIISGSNTDGEVDLFSGVMTGPQTKLDCKKQLQPSLTMIESSEQDVVLELQEYRTFEYYDIRVLVNLTCVLLDGSKVELSATLPNYRVYNQVK